MHKSVTTQTVTDFNSDTDAGFRAISLFFSPRGLVTAGVKWMDKRQRENTAHLLATMHIVLRQQDGQEQGTGRYRHLTNTSFEKVVDRCCCDSKDPRERVLEKSRKPLGQIPLG